MVVTILKSYSGGISNVPSTEASGGIIKQQLWKAALANNSMLLAVLLKELVRDQIVNHINNLLAINQAMKLTPDTAAHEASESDNRNTKTYNVS